MTYDLLVIGGGIVGLACAAEAAGRGKSALLIERHPSFGQETSSRNSEVVHSGIYYPTGSLKARLCLAGNATTYADCDRHGVWYSRCGKLIVAVTEDEEPELERLWKLGTANGVEGMEMLDFSQARRLEPHIACRGAILIPSTGIVDSHGLMKAYFHEAAAGGCDIVFGVRFTGGERANGTFDVRVQEQAGGETRFSALAVINAAGLQSEEVARRFGVDTAAAGYRLHPNRGHYYALSMAKSALVNRLIYPVPYRHLVGAGIHITLDSAGMCKLGPDAEYIDSSLPESEWYRFDDTRREKFYAAVKRYFPALDREDLSPDQVGVRPKREGSSGSLMDFVIAEESAKGLPGLVNLIGIESPGLTSAREIAREALRLLESTA